MRYTVHVDEADNPDELAEDLRALDLRGYKVECAALDERLRRGQRDDYLRKACSLLLGTLRCVALEREICRFEAVLWPRWRDRDTPPEPCSTLRHYLFEARRRGPLPSTARQLLNIIAKSDARGNFGEKRL